MPFVHLFLRLAFFRLLRSFRCFFLSHFGSLGPGSVQLYLVPHVFAEVVIPADLPAGIAQDVRRLAIDAFKAIDCAGMARVDFLLARPGGAIFVNEVNTIPGFTTISMFSKLWAASGIDYPTLLDRLVSLALERHAEKQQLRTSVT